MQSLSEAYYYAMTKERTRFMKMQESVLVAKDDRSINVILPFEKDGEYFVEDLGELSPKPAYAFWKRCLDVVVSFTGLTVLLVPMAVIAAAVWCTSEGSAFYCQERLGLNGKPFTVIKFRTMTNDAEKDGAQWSGGKKDVRITPLGRFLRNTRLDELPQLWCILKGEMSLVGPRPEREVFYDRFEQYVHGFRERLKVKPGLTGLAQINGGYELKPEEKIVYDVDYIKNRSLGMDLKIILRTFKVVFTHEGAK